MMIDDDDHHQSHENKPSRPLETSHCVAVEGVADCKVPDHHRNGQDLIGDDDGHETGGDDCNDDADDNDVEV